MKKKKGLIFSIAFVVFFAVRSLSGQPIISSVIQVSPEELINAEEVSITVDPLNPAHLAAGSGPNYFYYSDTHGQSWQGDGISSSYGQAGDASLTSDSKGNIFHAHLSSPISTYWMDRIVIQKSTNDGKSFSDGSYVGVHPNKQQYKEYIFCDRSASSPYLDNLYLCWTEFDVYPDQNTPGKFDSSRILFSRSTDHGNSWSSPIQISDRQGNCGDSNTTVEGATCATASNGDLYITWSGPDGLMFDKSTDGGKTFGKDKIISALTPGWNIPIDGFAHCNGFATILCDISNKKHNGNLYVIFSDKRNGPKNADIFLMRSGDGGNSWDSPVRINNDTTEFEQFMPASAIDQTTGALYSVFFDRRNTNGGTLTDLYLARSVDGGSNFTNYRLTVNPVVAYSGVFFTDYIGIAASNSYIYPIWNQANKNTLVIDMCVVIDTEALHADVHEPTGNSDELLTLEVSPNPANVNITFDLHNHAGQYISVALTDVVGRNVAMIYQGRTAGGNINLSYDSGHLPNGIYYCVVQSGKERTVRKLIILH